MTSAAATLRALDGLAASSWKIDAGRMRLSVRIPANTEAEIVLPVADAAGVTIDGQPLVRHAEASGVRVAGLSGPRAAERHV